MTWETAGWGVVVIETLPLKALGVLFMHPAARREIDTSAGPTGMQCGPEPADLTDFTHTADISRMLGCIRSEVPLSSYYQSGTEENGDSRQDSFLKRTNRIEIEGRERSQGIPLKGLGEWLPEEDGG